MKAIVLEKHAFTGGSFIGTEGLFAVGSHWQKEAGETFTAADEREFLTLLDRLFGISLPSAQGLWEVQP